MSELYPLVLPFLRRILSAVLTLFLATLFIFSFLRILPGDPVELMLGEQALPAAREELRRALGLDQPYLPSLVSYFDGLFRGNMGESFSRKEPVFPLILRHFPPTLVLAGSSIGIALITGLILGGIGGLKPGSILDRLSRAGSALGICLPSFLLGPLLLLYFAVLNPLFPLGGYEDPFSLVLPTLTLSAPLSGGIARIFRNTLCDLWGEPFLAAARARGVGKGRLFYRHMFWIAFYPLLTVLGLQLGALLTGTVIAETLFQWPGLGWLLVEAIYARDYPLIQGLVLIFTATYIIVNTFVDLLYHFLDPRVRRS